MNEPVHEKKSKRPQTGLGSLHDLKHPKLGEFAATAICGNDITSSCLYVSAFAIGASGKLAPVALLIVAFVLFLFRAIYAEVVGALPLNGGAYNALLNTTSKSRASVAACLTILSYMATAVISAGEAMHYASNLWKLAVRSTDFPVVPATVGLLAFFLCLTIIGISESARVAIGIFVTHLLTLTLLLLVGVAYVLFSPSGMLTLRDNLDRPLFVSERIEGDAAAGATSATHANGTATETDGSAIEVNDNAAATSGNGTKASGNGTEANSNGTETSGNGTETLSEAEKTEPSRSTASEPHGGKQASFRTQAIGWVRALFFGFAVALLGISGFESSSNFVEEQAEGVFPKTLRNMWMAVSIFNPAMAMLALALVPIITVQQDSEVQFALLAHMGFVAGGSGTFGTVLSSIISIDAFLVLSGAVLTSFVGVNGLVHRMTLDRCLPQFLLLTNRRGTTHRILVTFFLMCVSVLLITRGSIEALGGVYTLSFLTVMALFGVGNILLKVKRAQLPRKARAPWLAVFVAIAAVLLGLVGNAIRNPDYVAVFLQYFIPMMMIVGLMLFRIPLLKLCLTFVRAVTASLIGPLNRAARFVRQWIDDINSQQIVFFTRGDNIANLNTAMLYVHENEDTHRMKVVTVVGEQDQPPPRLKQDLEFLDEAYPEIDIEYVVIRGVFGPELIKDLSEKWHVPTNLIFIGSPRGKLGYTLAELHGVRLII